MTPSSVDVPVMFLRSWIGFELGRYGREKDRPILSAAAVKEPEVHKMTTMMMDAVHFAAAYLLGFVRAALSRVDGIGSSQD